MRTHPVLNLLAFVLGFSARASAATPARPNGLLLISDDLANASRVRFDRAYRSSPLCSPSRQGHWAPVVR